MDGLQVMLVVERDAEVRGHLKRALEETCHGVTVYSVGDLADALQVLTGSIFRIDMICMAEETFLTLCANHNASSPL